MKKFIIGILCLAMLTGCGKVNDDSGTDSRITISSGTIPSKTEAETDAASETEADGSVTTKKNKVIIVTTITAVSKVGATTSKKRLYTYSSNKATQTEAETPTHDTGKTYGTTVAVQTARPKVTTTTTTASKITEATTTAKTTLPPVDIDPEDQSDITLGVTDKGVDVRRSGTLVQKLSVNTDAITSYMNSGKKRMDELIFKTDFNFDGYTDLFITENVDEFNATGKYFRYNPSTGFYEDWDTLNEMGYSATANGEAGTVTIRVNEDEDQFEEKTYQWDEKGKLSLTQRVRQYKGEDDVIYTDYYSVVYVTETLFKREKTENGETVDVPLSEQTTTTTAAPTQAATTTTAAPPEKKE